MISGWYSSKKHFIPHQTHPANTFTFWISLKTVDTGILNRQSGCIKAQCPSFPSPFHITSLPFESLIFARLPTVAKNKLTCLRKKGSKPYFATGVSHVLRRFNRWDILEYAIAEAYDCDNGARHNTDGRCLEQDCSDENVDWRSVSDSGLNADKLCPPTHICRDQES